MSVLLIVDDDDAIREIFSLLLTENGYSVHAASGGMECIEILTRISPDLVLLDIMMHPVDGWETLSSIRNNPRTGHIPVVMFSGKSPSREEVFQYAGWIEDYLMKPLTMQTISRALSAVFARKRADLEERQHFIKNCADPMLIEEYFQLQRLLFIQGKFSRDFDEEPTINGGVRFPQKSRFEELRRALYAIGSDCRQFHSSPGSGN
jgi:two-component system, OmpR family, response regulator